MRINDRMFNRVIDDPELDAKIVMEHKATNIKELSNELCESLKCGDVVYKEDSTGKHAYEVTFKSATGMCLTYHDASVIETQSYDKIDGVWTYNSEDKSPVSPDGIVKELEDKDLKVKTIEVLQPNDTIAFEFENSDFPTGVEVTNIYNKCVRYGSLLYIVTNFVVENPTEASINIASIAKSITLPENIAEKIYDYGGNKVTSSAPTVNQRDITTGVGFTGINGIISGVQKICYIRHTGVNQIQLEITLSITLASSGKNAYTMRTFLLLA